MEHNPVPCNFALKNASRLKLGFCPYTRRETKFKKLFFTAIYRRSRICLPHHNRQEQIEHIFICANIKAAAEGAHLIVYIVINSTIYTSIDRRRPLLNMIILPSTRIDKERVPIIIVERSDCASSAFICTICPASAAPKGGIHIGGAACSCSYSHRITY